MALDVLAHFSVSVTSADSAWQTASSSGIPHLSTILSFIDAIHADASGCIESAPVNVLSSNHSKAIDSIQSLQTILRRLRSIIAGLERWLPEIDSSHPVSAIANQFVQELRLDLNAKQAVLDKIIEIIREGWTIDQADIDLWTGTWIEQVERTDHAAVDVVVGIIEAHAIMESVKNDGNNKSEMDSQQRLAGEEESKLSPALAMLKSKGKKRR